MSYEVHAQSCCMSLCLREYLLAVLLYLVQELLREDPPSNRETTLGGCLADNLLHVRALCSCCALLLVFIFLDAICVFREGINGG